jgi:hypothetical protein
MSYIGNPLITAAFVTDQFSGTGSQTVFTTSVAPAGTGAVLVAVSGVLQDPTTYAVSGTTLTFTQAPPSGTGNISCRYLGIPASGVTSTAYRTVTNFTATAGQTVFTPPSYTSGYIDVYRNGVKLALADFTATNGTTVTLASPAALNDVIETDSFYVSSVLNAIPATAGAVNSTYIANGAVGSSALANLTTLPTSGGNITLPAVTGTAMVSGNMPAFSAYLASNQTITSSTFTKVQINTKEFDTASAYDNTTNYRFTPLVAGYYQVNASFRYDASSLPTRAFITIYKNGAEFKRGTDTGNNTTEGVVSALIYLNGSTDYIELYAYITATTAVIGTAGQATNYFQASLVRAA